MNLVYTMRINKQKAIRQCHRREHGFKHLGQFILICIIAGTYPALGLINSRFFGLDFFNAGLLTSDMHNLSKIKIKSTIFLENIPQLFIQVVYTIAIGEPVHYNLAFIASSLSIIASVVIYQAEKEQIEEVVITKQILKLNKKG